MKTYVFENKEGKQVCMTQAEIDKAIYNIEDTTVLNIPKDGPDNYLLLRIE